MVYLRQWATDTDSRTLSWNYSIKFCRCNAVILICSSDIRIHVLYGCRSKGDSKLITWLMEPAGVCMLNRNLPPRTDTSRLLGFALIKRKHSPANVFRVSTTAIIQVYLLLIWCVRHGYYLHGQPHAYGQRNNSFFSISLWLYKSNCCLKLSRFLQVFRIQSWRGIQSQRSKAAPVCAPSAPHGAASHGAARRRTALHAHDAESLRCRA